MQTSGDQRRERAAPCLFNSCGRGCGFGVGAAIRIRVTRAPQRFQLTVQVYEETIQSLRMSGIGRRLAKMHFRRASARIIRSCIAATYRKRYC
jgi:hypothetical protein